MGRLAFIDTETTGLDPINNEIIEIAIKIIDTEVIRTSCRTDVVYEFEGKFKIRCMETASPKALEINGYNQEEWKDAYTWSKPACERLLERLKGCVVVGHNVQFDVTFIRESLKRKGYPHRLAYPMIDTITLAHEHLQPIGLRSMKLDNIRKLMGWPMEGSHTALVDAETTRRLYHTLIRRSWWDR